MKYTGLIKNKPMEKDKEPKKWVEKYETKVAVKSTFEDMIEAALKPNNKEVK